MERNEVSGSDVMKSNGRAYAGEKRDTKDAGSQRTKMERPTPIRWERRRGSQSSARRKREDESGNGGVGEEGLAAEDSGNGEHDDGSRVSLTRRGQGQTQLVRNKR